MSPFDRPPAADDPLWPRASDWLANGSDRPDLVVVGVPTSVGSISPSRADVTPPAVRDALRRLSPLDPVLGVDLDGFGVADRGDWPVADLALDAMVQEVRRRAAALQAGPVHCFLGGDNAVTRPLAAGLLGPDLSRVGLVTLDAHHDVRRLDDGPRNGTPVRGLLEDGLPGEQVVQIGIGAFANSAPYRRWCADHGIRSITATQVRERGIDVVVDEALTALDGCEAIYVDLDVDVLDSAFAPACPGARPGGLDPQELLAAARRLGAHPSVAAVDLVEVDAAADPDGRTVMVTAMALLAVAAGVASRRTA